MWLFKYAPEDPEHHTVIHKHGAEALYSTLKSFMHGIWTQYKEAEPDVAHPMIQIGNHWAIRWWLESRHLDGIPVNPIPMVNAHLIDPEWTEDVQTKLNTIVESRTTQGASVAWRVHWWRLAYCVLVLWDTKNCNDNSAKCYYEWSLNTNVDSPIVLWITVSIRPMIADESVQYPEHDEEEASGEALLHKQESNANALPNTSCSLMAVLFCPLSGRVHHMKWWLMKYFVDHVDIFHSCAEIGNNECKEIELTFLDYSNIRLFVTTPKVSVTSNISSQHTVW